MIPKNQCQEGHLYRVVGRNFNLAVFRRGVFAGRAFSCGTFFLEEERHYEELQHGCCEPLEDLGPSGVDTKDYDALLEFLGEASA